jgi:hypothetical protein
MTRGNSSAFQAGAVQAIAKSRAQQAYEELVVFVRAPDATRADVARSIRLFDAKDVAIRSSGELKVDEVLQEKEHGWAARRYSVHAGIYRLSYETVNRKTVEQTVYVFKGRRTFAFLKYGQALELVPETDGFRQARRRGIDPAQTTLISAEASDTNPSPDDLRLGDILLHALVSDEVGIDQNLVQRLAEPGACPYLKLYASVVLILRREQLESDGDPNEAAEQFEQTSPQIPPTWLEETSDKLLRSMPQEQAWPDAQCCGWRLAALTQNRFSIDTNDALAAPPMLDCTWRWAVAHSFDSAKALPSVGTFRSASTARVQVAPWLVWRSAAPAMQKGNLPPSAQDVSANLANLMIEIGHLGSQQLAAATPAETVAASERAQRLFDFLTPPARQTIGTLLNLGRSSGGTFDTPDIKTVGSSLGAPKETLQRLVGDALSQLQKFKGSV